MTSAQIGMMVICAAFGFGGVWYMLGLLGSKGRLAAKEPVQPSYAPAEWFEVLNVSATSDWPTIKAAYLKEISRYHPDKFEALDSEFVSIASRRAKAINDAFTTAKKVRQKI